MRKKRDWDQISLDHEETMVVKNLVYDYNQKTAGTDPVLVALEKRLVAHLKVATVPRRFLGRV